MIRGLDKLLAPLRVRIANLVARAVVQLVNDGAKLQVLQLGVLDGETREAAERVQQYGFTSHPLPGAEAVVLSVGGRRDHLLVVAVDDRRHRKAGLGEGEVALYNHAGVSVLLRADGTVEVGGGTMQPAALGQDVRDELDDLRAKFAAHTHAVTVTGSATTQSGTSLATAATLAAAKPVRSATVKVRT
jgi:phage baseplate assembly protein V